MNALQVVIQIVGAVASVATAIAVFVAAKQIKVSRELARTQFEDGLAREYREVVQRVPVRALLGEDVPEPEYQEALDDLYRYIDLSNEQAFLRQKQRVSLATWVNWREGIASNLSLPVFKRAWEEVKANAPSRFDELRWLENTSFQGDPAERSNSAI